MRGAEDAARQSGKSLLVLDTASSDAERLYVRLGWTLAGIVPDYALLPQGGLCATSFYYRSLEPQDARHDCAPLRSRSRAPIVIPCQAEALSGYPLKIRPSSKLHFQPSLRAE